MLPLFSKKAISQRCAQQLDGLAREQAVAQFEQTDTDDRIKSSGKARILQFNLQDGTLIIELPTKLGRPLPVGPGDTAKLFVTIESAIFMFDTTVIERTTTELSNGQPIPTLKIEAPEMLQSGNRRRHVRVVPIASAPANVTWRIAGLDKKIANTRPWNKSKVQDISSRGVGIYIAPELADNLEIGRLLEVKVEVATPTAKETIATQGIIRRLIAPREAKKPTFLGIEFEIPGKDKDACIEKLVFYIMFCQIELARAQRERE
ncbi:flagellar brake protein [bacterium]|nr:flagellar brake protein [bacterium]